MLKTFKSAFLLSMLALTAYIPDASADCKKCHHHLRDLYPIRYIGTYIRNDVTDIQTFSQPLIQLNADGNASVYFGESLIEYVTEGTISPTYGRWKFIGDNKVLVMTIGWEALDTTKEQTFGGVRDTFIIDFSGSLDFPKITERAVVLFPNPTPSSLLLDPNAGNVLVSGRLPTPRQLQRVRAFATDLTRQVTSQ